MDLVAKLEILADAAKYDVACTSSGIDRDAQKGKLGNTLAAGCCHSFAADGRCITLLKVLMTNVCVYDCAYCVNRASNEVPRAAFKPRELADLTIAFYRRNYIEGLFLSSGVIRNPDYTTELMIQTLSILREEHGFRGYIHAKAVPGTSPELVQQLGHLADRMSVNMELPSQKSLQLLAPQKDKQRIIAPMRQIRDNIAQDSDTRALVRKQTTYMRQIRPKKKERAFVPAGQSTQMIVGASPESDFQILNLSAALYRTLSLKRVFFSAYTPVNDDKRLPGTDAVQLNREHRLYQADWLLRFYRFDVTEIIDEDNPFLDPDLDPKANWAINHLDFFPVEVNTAPLEALLRVPGIGVRGANLIVRARRTTCLREPELRKLGIAYKRARFFITCSGSYSGRGVDFSPEGLRAQLAAPIKGGNHGRRADKTTPGQMSLFESVETPEKARIAGGSGARALESGDAAAAACCSDAERSSNEASSSGRAASADGTYGWQRALETPEAVCARAESPPRTRPSSPKNPWPRSPTATTARSRVCCPPCSRHTRAARTRRTSPAPTSCSRGSAKPCASSRRTRSMPCAFGAASGGRAETPPTMPSSTPRSATTRTPAPSCTASSATPWRRTGRTIAPAARAAEHAAARAGSSPARARPAAVCWATSPTPPSSRSTASPAPS